MLCLAAVWILPTKHLFGYYCYVKIVHMSLLQQIIAGLIKNAFSGSRLPFLNCDNCCVPILVPPEPQRNVSIAAVRGAVRPSKIAIKTRTNTLYCFHLLYMSMGVYYVVIGFDMEVQPLVTHNAALPFCVSAMCTDVVSNHLLFAHMP